MKYLKTFNESTREVYCRPGDYILYNKSAIEEDDIDIGKIITVFDEYYTITHFEENILPGFEGTAEDTTNIGADTVVEKIEMNDESIVNLLERYPDFTKKFYNLLYDDQKEKFKYLFRPYNIGLMDYEVY